MKKAPSVNKKVYITLEDEEAIEGWPLPAIVPAVFSESRGKIECECYFGVYEAVRAYLYEYKDRLFSKEGLTELNRALQPYLKEQGYERMGGLLRYYRSFVLWKEKDLKKDAIRGDSYLLDRALLEEIKVNRTGFDLEELLLAKLPTVLTLEKGEVLSIASVNEHSPGKRLLEATVYTLPDRRKKGYGASNVAKLSEDLLRQKKGVVYCCSCRNAASISLARSLGFTPESRFYAVDAYRIEE